MRRRPVRIQTAEQTERLRRLHDEAAQCFNRSNTKEQAVRLLAGIASLVGAPARTDDGSERDR